MLITPDKTDFFRDDYIAYQQFKINKNNFKRDLYEKRYKIYSEIIEFLESIVTHGNVKTDEQIKFYRHTRENIFLFDDIKIKDHINEIYKQSNEFQLTNKILDRKMKVDDETYKKAADKDMELMKWFNEQFDITEKLFSKHLSLKL